MRTGRVFILIGVILGLLSLLLGFILPELFCWYRFEMNNMGITSGWYLTGFGTVITKGYIAPLGLSVVELIGGIVVIVGVILCIVGATKESKIPGIIGGIMILLGPILAIFDLLIGISGLAEAMGLFVDWTDGSIFWGTHTDMGIVYSWSLWIGSFMALVGGFLGLIGGVAV